MNSGNNVTLLESKTQHKATQVGWDEFRKLVQIGDTYEADGLTKTVTKKTYVLDATYTTFEIQVGVS